MGTEPGVRPWRRQRPAHPLLLDGLAAAVFGLLAFGFVGAGESNQALAAAATTLAAATVPLARRRPAVAVAGALAVFWLAPVSPRYYGWLALIPLAYALYRMAERHHVAVAAGALGAGLTGPVATALPSFEHSGGMVAFALGLAVAWTVGVAVRQHRLYVQELVRQEARRVEERATQERARIARELHDVVAHGMSVITVQAAYGRLAGKSRPSEAAGALAAIETTGRQSLGELRRLLGVLRAGESDPAGTEPAPALADLPRLAEQTGRAGVRVEVSVSGEARALGPGLELSAYRIVQEALTNVVKHADTDSARVTVDYRPEVLVLHIADRGCGGAVRTEGYGLPGMRERAALYGGTVKAGPAPGGGFVVTATLPQAPDGAP